LCKPAASASAVGIFEPSGVGFLEVEVSESLILQVCHRVVVNFNIFVKAFGFVLLVAEIGRASWFVIQAAKLIVDVESRVYTLRFLIHFKYNLAMWINLLLNGSDHLWRWITYE
jgi:hypothetical protein